MTLVSSPQTAPTAPRDHRKNSRRFGTGLSQIRSNESQSSTELGSTNFTNPKTFCFHEHDTALAECVYRLISTLIMFMESGLQEIGHSRSHSCSQAPEEAWIEPGKCQISLKISQDLEAFCSFFRLMGSVPSIEKMFFRPKPQFCLDRSLFQQYDFGFQPADVAYGAQGPPKQFPPFWDSQIPRSRI